MPFCESEAASVFCVFFRKCLPLSCGLSLLRCRACLCSPRNTARHVLRPRHPRRGRLRSPAWEIGLPSNGFFFSAAGQIIYFRDIIREVFEDFIKICKKWVAIKATHPIKMEFSKLLLHRLYFWSFLRQAHHYVVP